MKPIDHDDWTRLVSSRFPQDGRDVDFVDEEARRIICGCWCRAAWPNPAWMCMRQLPNWSVSPANARGVP
ncbi:MAG: hypothetical protein PHX87_01665 [Candidatus Peribacteraceae bacterium]|nr:hypothetical protein [Candidatus Peribacteraceae bacterium]MDD5742115.1 hypothetical protein [Candidatus Peribacteraceae bacterium]